MPRLGKKARADAATPATADGEHHGAERAPNGSGNGAAADATARRRRRRPLGPRHAEPLQEEEEARR